MCAMEDVLEVYHRLYGDNEVLVCLDEMSKQQTKETRLPCPARPGASGVYDYEYERNGVSNMFMLFAPLEGWRRVEVTDRRTRADWARVVEQLVDVDYADKDRIVLVMDNLNTHHPASLYEAFEPAEARRIAERLEIHYTPKHGSWLNMAEIEIGVMVRQCLARRIPDQSVLRREVEAWQGQRNRDAIRVDWRFTTTDARIKLQSLYPSIQHGPTTKPIPRWDVHLGGLEDDREDSTAPHMTFRPRIGGHRQCGLAISTFHLGFSLGRARYTKPIPRDGAIYRPLRLSKQDRIENPHVELRS